VEAPLGAAPRRRGFGVLPDQQAFGGLPNAMLAFHTSVACTAPSAVVFLLMPMPPTLAPRCATIAFTAAGGITTRFGLLLQKWALLCVTVTQP